MKYFFILGKNPKLSIAEIESVFELLNIQHTIAKQFVNVIIVEVEKDLDVDKIMKRLGGTVKIGEIKGEVKKVEEVQEVFFKEFEIPEGKVFFGFSLYSINELVELKHYVGKLKHVGMEIKKRLSKKGHGARMVVSKEPGLSSVIVKKEKLLRRGADICLFFNKGSILVGKTLAVQEFEAFGHRDYGRPGRDDVSGMLPPKLARIMVNLAQAKPSDTILDPFCGSGTVIQEALLLGHTSIIASDLEEKAVQNTNENTNWLSREYNIDISGVQIIQSPVEEVSKHIQRADVIITEPYLGPPLKGKETKEELLEVKEALEVLYLNAFKEFQKILPNGGKVVMVFPAFKYNDKLISLEIGEEIEKLGFISLRKDPLLYFREKQKVRREIWEFVKM